jgi:hypothetical protein
VNCFFICVFQMSFDISIEKEWNFLIVVVCEQCQEGNLKK